MPTFTLKGETFTTDLLDSEAIEIVAKLSSGFANSLAAQYARKGSLSDRQWPWVHKLAHDATRPAPEPLNVDCGPIVARFHAAQASGMRRASVTLPGLRFALAGARSRYPGAIHVSDGSGYSGRYFGRIEPDGTFQPGRNASDVPLELLQSFAADPAGTTAEYGSESGACCYCGRELSTTESLAAGYGPVCAERWGLPWG